jgi:cytochrome P450
LIKTLFTAEGRRNPYPHYDQFRADVPLFRDPITGLWMVFDYQGVKRLLNEQESFSSRLGPDWLIFADPPRHAKLRALISQAFTPKSIASLEPRIVELSRQLLETPLQRGEMDMAADFSVQLPMMVIAEMLGVAPSDRAQFQRWIDVLLNMSYTIPGGKEAEGAESDFVKITVEMGDYLARLLEERRKAPKDDLLTRLAQAELDGERLTQEEILGFFQLLLLAGSETTTNLLNNAILSLVEHPQELRRLQAHPELLPSAIEEVLRYRSPLQWMFRVTRRDVELHGQTIPARKVVLAMIGSANRDPGHFVEPNRFDITRQPNPHLAFGHGLHFCLGSALGRMEARVALSELFARVNNIRLASSEPWEPRKGLHVQGPTRLPIQFDRR